MSLAELVAKGREAILSQWAQQADAVYAFETAGFVRSSRDSLSNPVGQRTRDAAVALFDALLGPEPNLDALVPSLTEFVKVRAVQDASPEKALAVLFAFKPLIRAYLASQSVFVDFALREELTRLETRCDELALLAFALYSHCREELFQLRLRDMRRRSDVFVRLARQRGQNGPEDPAGS